VADRDAGAPPTIPPAPRQTMCINGFRPGCACPGGTRLACPEPTDRAWNWAAHSSQQIAWDRGRFEWAAGV